MVRDNTIWAFAVVAIFLAVGLTGLNHAANDNTTTLLVENESVTIDFQNASSVDPPQEALGFEPNATVFNSSGVELINGTDFRWHPSNGTIEWFDTANTSDGEAATVTYEFLARTERTRGINRVMNVVARPLALLFIFAVVGSVFRYGTGW